VLPRRSTLGAPRAYADPYIAGVALGLVLLAAFVVMGRGLGASGAFASAASGVVAIASPERAAGSALFARYLNSAGSPWLDWLVVELAGVMIGGATSAWLSGRLRIAIDKGPRITHRARLLAAFAGGSAMGIGAVLARGCTSGLALTGGAMLSVGSWLFIVTAFAGGYAVVPLFKRLWA
jgi:hypothetical protein